MPRVPLSGCLLFAFALGLFLPAAPRGGEAPSVRRELSVTSGVHHGASGGVRVAARRVVGDLGAPWVRVEFGETRLGRHSRIRITGPEGAVQVLDPASFERWRGTSAYFNGGTVTLELLVDPRDEGVSFSVDSVILGEWVGDGPDPSQCGGTDDRVASADPAVGRLSFINPDGSGSTFCTAWMTAVGALLTAGHCVDFDPDQDGPLLPDGVMDWDATTTVEFDVPASTAGGTPVFADPTDQYPVDLATVVWQFEGTGEGFGKDWAVFGALANDSTGASPYAAQGSFYRVRTDILSNGADTRITGYGIDTGAANRTQQTHVGPFQGHSSNSEGDWLKYQVDTEGANSGSPVIAEGSGIALGIHTNAGCTENFPIGSNKGTSFLHAALQIAVNGFLGPNTVFVDNGVFTFDTGSAFNPRPTLASGAANAISGGILAVVAGTYPESGVVLSTPSTVVAPSGRVVIGTSP